MKNSDINTFVIYESPKRLLKLVETLNENFEDSLIFIASDLTKIHERGFFGKIIDVLEILKKDEKIEKGEYVVILQKEKKIYNEQKEEKLLSIEALLIDIIVKNNCTLKEAINLLQNNRKIKKKYIYSASLNLKKIFGK